MAENELGEPDLGWALGMFLAMIEKIERETNKPAAVDGAELTAVFYGLDTRIGNRRKEPNRLAEGRLYRNARKRLAQYSDPLSPRFGEGKRKTARLLAELARVGLLTVQGELLYLTPLGRAEVRAFMGSVDTE